MFQATGPNQSGGLEDTLKRATHPDPHKDPQSAAPSRQSPWGLRLGLVQTNPDAVARLLSEVVYFAHAIHWSGNSFHAGLDLQSQEL